MVKAKKGLSHRIVPVKPNKALKIFEKLGFKQYKSKGGTSHIVMKRHDNDPDFFILVKHGNKEIDPRAIETKLKNGKIDKEKYLEVYNSI